jgi:hypothetical protein
MLINTYELQLVKNNDIHVQCLLNKLIFYQEIKIIFWIHVNKGNNKITELRKILQRESQNS